MIGRLHNLPIGRKIFAITSMASGVALLVTFLVTLAYEASAFKPQMVRELKARADILAPTTTAGLSFFDTRAVAEDLATFATQPGIRAAAVYDREGELFASWRRDELTDLEFRSSPRPSGVLFHGSVVELWAEISDENQAIGHLFVERDLPPLYARLPQYGLMLLGVAFALTLASAFLLLVLRRTVSQPILELSRAAAKVRDREDYGVRASPGGGDEVGDLTTAFNEMLEVIEQREQALSQAGEEQRVLQQELAQAQKMESIGRLAGGVAHDFNNYLTVIIGATEMAVDNLPAEGRTPELLQSSLTAAGQAANLTRSLLAFARKQLIVPTVLDPNALLLELGQMLPSLIKEDINLNIKTEPQPWSVWVDRGQLTQVLMNLATNARDAMPRGGELSIDILNTDVASPVRGLADMPPGQYVRITVSDTGEGMDAQTRKHLFEPFFTTKERGDGTGLGLATSYGIILQSGGHLYVESELGKGTQVHIYLRRHDASADRGLADPQVAPAPVGDETVLVVEDNASVRSNLVALLKARGYHVLEAASGPEALLLASRIGDELDLLVTDVVMPQMSGPAVATALRDERPCLRVLYISGYPVDEMSARELRREGTAFLSKPFNQDDLARQVRNLIDDLR